MNRTNGNGLPRTKYMKHTLNLTLEDMYNGTIRRLAVNKDKVCDLCNGTGSKNLMDEVYDTCEDCNGYGVQQNRIDRECELCRGNGLTIIGDNRCAKCEGKKTVPDKSVLRVKIRRGVRHLQRIFFENEGTQEPNMKPGYVVVKLEQLRHSTFERLGDDLFMTMSLDLVESLCGFEKVVTTFDKRRLCVRIPPGKIIKDEDVKCIMGEGMPRYDNPQERGKLIIRFKINLPSSIRARLAPLIEACLPPRPTTVIPMDAVECNMINMTSAEEENNQDQSNENDHDNGMDDQYGSDEQYDEQGQYYQNDGYDVQGNYDPSEYDQYQQEYDAHSSQNQEDDCESLESYDATQQYRFND